MSKLLIRCPKCGLENWAPAVSSGICAWCGYSVKNPVGDNPKLYHEGGITLKNTTLNADIVEEYEH